MNFVKNLYGNMMKNIFFFNLLLIVLHSTAMEKEKYPQENSDITYLDLQKMSAGDALMFYGTLTKTQEAYFKHIKQADSEFSIADLFYVLHVQSCHNQLKTFQQQFATALKDRNTTLLYIIPQVVEELKINPKEIGEKYLEPYSECQKAYFKELRHAGYPISLDQLWQFSCKTAPEKLQILRTQFRIAARDNYVPLLQVIPKLAQDLELKPIEIAPGKYKYLEHYSALYNAVKLGHYESSKELLGQMTLHSDPENLFYMVCYLKWHENENKQQEIMNLFLQKGAHIYKSYTTPI